MIQVFNISVVIPTYNSSEKVSRAIDSALLQTFPVFEIIVINDGSSDATEHILSQYLNKIKYVNLKQNYGVSVARNIGIKKATGNWIAFLDADDSWLPGKLEAQVRLLQSNPSLKWCITNYKKYSSNFEEINAKRPPRSSICEHDHIYSKDGYVFRNYFEAAWKGSYTAHTSTVLIHRDIFNVTGTFDESLKRSQDLDLWWRLALRNPKVGYIHKPLVARELYGGDDLLMTRRVTAKRGDYLRKVYEKNIKEALKVAGKSTTGEKAILHSFFAFASYNLFKSILMMVFLGHTDKARETFLQFDSLFITYQKIVLKIVVVFPFMPQIIRFAYYLSQKIGLVSPTDKYWKYLRFSCKNNL